MAQRRALLISAALLYGLLLCATSACAQGLSVAEASVAFHLFPQPHIEVPVVNPAKQAVGATLAVEIIGNDSDKLIAQHERAFTAQPGSQTVTLDWNVDELPTKSVNFLSAYRLRYTLCPASLGEFPRVQGILQLGLHLADGFGIQGYPSGEFACAWHCQFLVRVADPNTGRALAGYNVQAKFNETVEHAGTIVNVVSDADGYAVVRYDVDGDSAPAQLMMQITVSHGAFSNGWGGEIFWQVPPHLTLTSDKETYRPGETVQMRLLLTNVRKQRWAAGNISLTITKRGAEHEFWKVKLVTSAGGEATAEWTVPEDLADGTFWIRAVSDDEPQNNWMAKSNAKIVVAAAERPKLNIRVVPDRAYYAPGQTAKLTITAKEPGGAPLSSGKVSVKSVWGGVLFSGALDAAGQVVAVVDPQKMWDWIATAAVPGFPAPRTWDFLADAEVTDPASGATESRRVTLLLAPQELYLVVADRPRMGSENTLSIVSAYVDKSPALVDGVAEALAPNEQGPCPAANSALPRIALGQFHTNRYGVARLTLPGTWITYAHPKREDGPYSWHARVHPLGAPNEQATKTTCIAVQAKDRQGRSGTLLQQILVIAGTRFATRISTDHALYHPGEPIRVRIESDEGLTEAAVEARTWGWGLVDYQHLRLRNGRGEVTLPYHPDFRGLLTVQVYAVTAEEDPNTADSWSTNVLYPTGEGLQAGEHWGEEVGRPDEFQLANDHPNMVITPRDMERGQIARIKKEDLLRLDPAKPFPDGLDLVASELLGPPQSWGGWTWGYYVFQHEAFDKQNLAAVEAALQGMRTLREPHPATEPELLREFQAESVDFAALRDGWGTPYRVVRVPGAVCIVSNGPDKAPRTADDYVAAQVPWP